MIPIHQLAITFMLFFAGDRILAGHLDARPGVAQEALNTIIFNCFGGMQIFNEFKWVLFRMASEKVEQPLTNKQQPSSRQ
jgi:hypothetical protein